LVARLALHHLRLGEAACRLDRSAALSSRNLGLDRPLAEEDRASCRRGVARSAAAAGDCDCEEPSAVGSPELMSDLSANFCVMNDIAETSRMKKQHDEDEAVRREAERPLPGYQKPAFKCPRCGALSQMHWGPPMSSIDLHPSESYERNAIAAIAECEVCRECSVWAGTHELHRPPRSMQMVWPVVSAVGPPPNSDLPDDLLSDYDEARRTISVSPRGGCALARLVIEKLLKDELGAEGKNIFAMIGDLVAKGKASTEVKQALEGIRYLGNEAVHDGDLDLSGDEKTAVTLLMLINMIVQRAITEPKQAQAVFDRIPPNKKDGIEERDKPKS